MSRQGREEASVGGRNGTAATEYHDVDSFEEVAVVTKALACNAFQTIALNGEARAFLRNGKPEPSGMLSPGMGEDGKKGVARAYRFGENTVEIPGTLEARNPRKLGVGELAVALRDQGDKRARPLARRALSTLRPLRVAMRLRNPWVRARLIRLGWKVLFMANPRGTDAGRDFLRQRTKDRQR